MVQNLAIEYIFQDSLMRVYNNEILLHQQIQIVIKLILVLYSLSQKPIIQLNKKMGSYLGTNRWGVIYNDSKYDVFFTVHDCDKPCPFEQIAQIDRSSKTSEQIKERIRQIEGAQVLQVLSKNFSTVGLDNLKLDGRQRLSIVFDNGIIFQNSAMIITVDDARLKITQDLALSSLHKDHAAKLKMLSMAKRIEGQSNCTACIKQKKNSPSTPSKINFKFVCHLCNSIKNQEVFWICRESPIKHTVCDGCHNQNILAFKEKEDNKNASIKKKSQSLDCFDQDAFQQTTLNKKKQMSVHEQSNIQWSGLMGGQTVKKIVDSKDKSMSTPDSTKQNPEILNGLINHKQSKIHVQGLQQQYK